MDKLLDQDWTNPFTECNIGDTPFGIILAGEGPRNIQLPNGDVINCSDLKRDLGFPQLFAWNLERKALLEWVEYLNEHPECPCKLVVDSGAYSMWSRGKEFDVDEYIDFLNSNKVIETCFWAAEADVIPGRMNVEPTEQEKREAPEKSWNNFLYMIDRVKMPKKIVPIFHMHEDFKHLRRMVTYQYADGDFIPYIGISPANDSSISDKEKWYEQVWKIIYEECDRVGRSIPLNHNFGMTSISLMEQYPCYTADSTSYLRSGSFGNIMIVMNGKTKTVYVSNRNPDSPDHINNQPLAIKEAIEDWCKKLGYGLSLEALTNDDNGSLRIVWNVLMLDRWRRSFKYEGNMSFKESLW